MDNNQMNHMQNGRNNNQNDNNNGNKNGNNDNNKNRRSLMICLALALFMFLAFYAMNMQLKKATNVEITYDKFNSMLENGEIESVVITSSQINITPKKEKSDSAYYNITYYTGYISTDFGLVSRLEAANVPYNKEIAKTGTSFMDFLLFTVLPIILLWGGLFFAFRMISKNSGGMMGVGKSNAKMYVQKETGVTFKDVAGQEEAMESLTEMVDFLHNPQKYTEIGAKLPKGALLVGPPGTGKTLLAKAVAGEASVPFFSLSGSDFVEMFVGVGASRVRDLFKQAQSMAPCIIFIDEIDAIGKSRDSQYGGGNDEREQTLNQLLSEMDGFDSSKGLVVLGATNRPEVLDKALLRPGRFDRRVIVERPDLKGRVDILRVHAKDVLMDDTVDFDAIALATSGAAGSDLANMINEAAIMAVKAGRKAVSQNDLFEAVEVVIAGKEKKDRILGREEKRIVAYHEVGHALVTALEKNAEPVQKITIIPRTMGSLGYVMQVPEEEKYLMSKEEILARITTLFGGRAAEEVVFGSVTTGASNDIEKATSLARAMVTQYGMSEKFGLIGLESVESKYLDGRSVLNCGDATEAEIDTEVMRILKDCYDKALGLIREHRESLDEIAEFLIGKETINGKEFMEIFRRVSGIKEEYDMLVLDIDGTLTNSQKEVSEATRKAIIEIQEEGKAVVLASGRCFAGIQNTAEKISLNQYDSYILAYNGASVRNSRTGEAIYNIELPRDMIKPLYEAAVEFNVGISVYKDTEIITGHGIDQYIKTDARACQMEIREVEDFVGFVDFPVNKCLLSGEPAKMEKILPILRERFGDRISVFRSDPCYIELMPKNIDKAHAIGKLLDKLGKSKEKVICVGDSYNDISMIEYAGLGVAMGNALKEVKDKADFVTDSNDEDGIVKVIEKFMKEDQNKEKAEVVTETEAEE